MAQVSVEDAYREACLALGESLVLRRLQDREIARLAALVERGPDADDADAAAG